MINWNVVLTLMYRVSVYFIEFKEKADGYFEFSKVRDIVITKVVARATVPESEKFLPALHEYLVKRKRGWLMYV